MLMSNEQWLQQVYQPVNRLLYRFSILEQQINELAADP